jgi:diacylglycerol kinase (ATP)
MADKIHAIVNPRAAYGAAEKKWPVVLRHLEQAGFEVIWQFTRKRFHAYHIAKELVKKGARRIISVGGDGTFNEIINGVLSCKGHTLPELAIIPVGTGSDFAKTLGIPEEDWQAGIEVIKNGKIKSVDVGEIEFQTDKKTWKRYFANVFDAGLGGSVDRISNTIPKGVGGFLTFLLASLIAIITFKPIKFQVWIDDKFVDHALMPIIGVANGQFFGGDMHIAPMALTDDGIFEVLYVKDTNIFKFLFNVLAKVYKAEHLKYHNVYHHRAKKMKIKAEKICLLDVDGEVEKAKEFNVSIIPKALRIRVPNV